LKSGSGAGGALDDQHQALAVSRLHGYLDDGVRIPRAHLDRDDDVYDSTSQSSSEYTVREEVERRVITDVTKKETKKTLTTADVHGSTTAEFHVYPPIEIGTRQGGSLLLEKDEQERGESVAEFSIGNTRREWSTTARASEFSTDRDLESVMSDSTAEDEVYDKKTLVKRSHGFEPSTDGGTERYRTEVTTTTKSKGVTKS
uniref:Ankyrin n=1 Tax=Gongylonema pulchrum TaxID=637853 RepID=A0A183EGG8_9BILA